MHLAQLAKAELAPFARLPRVCREHLRRAVKRVGVTAASHRVIRNLLDAATKAAGEMGFAIECVDRVNEKSNAP